MLAVAWVAVFSLTGCMNDDSAETETGRPGSSVTESAPSTATPPPEGTGDEGEEGDESQEEASTARVRDPRGDAEAADVDIIGVAVRRTEESVGITIELAAPVSDDAVYSTSLRCDEGAVQLAWQRTNGVDDAFAFQFLKNRETPVTGEASGARVTVTAPAELVGCAGKSIRFYSVTETTDDRPPATDAAPNTGANSFTRKTAPIAPP